MNEKLIKAVLKQQIDNDRRGIPTIRKELYKQSIDMGRTITDLLITMAQFYTIG